MKSRVREIVELPAEKFAPVLAGDLYRRYSFYCGARSAHQKSLAKGSGEPMSSLPPDNSLTVTPQSRCQARMDATADGFAGSTANTSRSSRTR